MTAQADIAPDEARARASGSSFYAAMRILPAREREAIFEIYSFCREVDDIADEGSDRETQLRDLDRWRRHIDDIVEGRAPPPALRALADATRRFGLRREDFIAVIDGMEMDVRGPVRAPGWDELDLYCDRVASAVGRLCVRVFGLGEADGVALARHLGRALQLTNILRDIDEDAAMGRLYLPREALRAAGVSNDEPSEAVASPAIGAVCSEVAERASAHFAEADAIMARVPRRLVSTPRVMSAAYRMILARLKRRGWAAPRTRVRIARWRLLLIILRNAF